MTKLDKDTLASIDKGMSQEERINKGSFSKYAKQEEIREGIQKLFLKKAAELKKTGITGGIGKDFIDYLHSQG